MSLDLYKSRRVDLASTSCTRTQSLLPHASYDYSHPLSAHVTNNVALYTLSFFEFAVLASFVAISSHLQLSVPGLSYYPSNFGDGERTPASVLCPAKYFFRESATRGAATNNTLSDVSYPDTGLITYLAGFTM